MAWIDSQLNVLEADPENDESTKPPTVNPVTLEPEDVIDDDDNLLIVADPIQDFALVGMAMIGLIGYLFYDAFKKGE